MGRKAKFKKDNVVTYRGLTYHVAKDQHTYRGKESLFIESLNHTPFRVLAKDVKHAEHIAEITSDTTVTDLVEQFGSAVSIELVPVNQCSDTPLSTMNKYQRQIINSVGESIIVDVYDVLNAFTVTDPAIAHAIKKLLAPGTRGNKSLVQDLTESIKSVERAIEHQHSTAKYK